MIRFPRALRPVGEPVPVPGVRDVIGRNASNADTLGTLADLFRFEGYHSWLCGSGTSALASAVCAAVRERATAHPEVLIPAYACPDIVSAVVFAGAIPILVDNLPELPWMDPGDVRRALTSRTVAVVHMRFLGLPSNGTALREALGDGGPLLIEDSAHWFPPRMRVEGTSDFVVFSFGRGKPVSVRCGGLLLERAGRGGLHRPFQAASAARSWSEALIHLLRCASYNVAIQPTVYWFLTHVTRAAVDTVSWRELDRLAAFPASLAPSLSKAISSHRSRDNARQDALRAALCNIHGPWLDIPELLCGTKPAGADAERDGCRLWRYPLLIASEDRRDCLFRELWRAGLGPSRMYRHPLGEMPQICTRVRAGSTPRARDFASRLLTLPLHSGLQKDDSEKLIGLLQRFVGAQPRLRSAAGVMDSVRA